VSLQEICYDAYPIYCPYINFKQNLAMKKGFRSNSKNPCSAY
jgi:hypothetical protein